VTDLALRWRWASVSGSGREIRSGWVTAIEKALRLVKDWVSASGMELYSVSPTVSATEFAWAWQRELDWGKSTALEWGRDWVSASGMALNSVSPKALATVFAWV
jgi:hypothetical protein